MTSRASIAAIVEAKAYDYDLSYATQAPLHENLRSHGYFNDRSQSDQDEGDQDGSDQDQGTTCNLQAREGA